MQSNDQRRTPLLAAPRAGFGLEPETGEDMIRFGAVSGNETIHGMAGECGYLMACLGHFVAISPSGRRRPVPPLEALSSLKMGCEARADCEKA